MLSLSHMSMLNFAKLSSYFSFSLYCVRLYIKNTIKNTIVLIKYFFYAILEKFRISRLMYLHCIKECKYLLYSLCNWVNRHSFFENISEMIFEKNVFYFVEKFRIIFGYSYYFSVCGLIYFFWKVIVSSLLEVECRIFVFCDAIKSFVKILYHRYFGLCLSVSHLTQSYEQCRQRRSKGEHSGDKRQPRHQCRPTFCEQQAFQLQERKSRHKENATKRAKRRRRDPALFLCHSIPQTLALIPNLQPMEVFHG
ncbi:hypothetical protein FIV06_15690 [Labrenzia sp. THAF191b]|nr:hypothetical protein FIV06_15690 [Labrenzia sp. THAF191b]QFT05184.1 hypothetical protein FIV05_15685 [Labrenzia sp. THAF191a]QFT16728.1 hypothetical protein FIV03_15700 [Labrenzia sp. THAF187b]